MLEYHLRVLVGHCSRGLIDPESVGSSYPFSARPKQVVCARPKQVVSARPKQVVSTKLSRRSLSCLLI